MLEDAEVEPIAAGVREPVLGDARPSDYPERSAAERNYTYDGHEFGPEPLMPTGPANRLVPALRRVVLGRETADRSDGQLLAAYVNDRDADAFAVLVKRHGPMVLGVCRRTIGNADAADDAFQAVFLVLARHAGSIRSRGQVGNWLYGVAYRTAMKARMVLARRRCREKQVDAMPEPLAHAADSWSDLQPVIDEELARLPDRLRLPIILCDLEGRPQRAVAKELRIAPATLAGRLTSARRLLAQRLTRRGITLSGGALAILLGERASAAMIHSAMADGVVRAAEAVATGASTAGLVSAHAIQLCEGVMRMMLLTKLKAAGACALAALVLTGGIGFRLSPAAADDNAASAPIVKLVATPTSRLVGANDDAEFLRRLYRSLTGTAPTKLETGLFVADGDTKKRTKVVDWLLADDGVKEAIAKRMGIDASRVRGARMVQEKGKIARIAVVVAPQTAKIKFATAYDMDVRVRETVTGKFHFGLADNGETGLAESIVMNEHNFDLVTGQLIAEPRPAAVFADDLLLEIADPPAAKTRSWTVEIDSYLYVGNSDEAFLRRVVESARGTRPTALEQRYFAEDKDPKKRERLLDLLLRDPAVSKKVGDGWKKKMLESPPPVAFDYALPLQLQQGQDFEFFFGIDRSATPTRFEKLVGELLDAKKTDEQVLEAITLAAAGRLPTAEEKRATLAVISVAADKKAAWIKLAETLARPGENRSSGK